MFILKILWYTYAAICAVIGLVLFGGVIWDIVTQMGKWDIPERK